MITIEHLPNNRWRMYHRGLDRKSDEFRYEQRGWWIVDKTIYLAQTCYFGEEYVMMAYDPFTVEHESKDLTMPTT